MNQFYHKSVLVREVIHYLALKAEHTYVDATFGGGGHTQAILDANPSCRVIAFDWDQKAIELNGPALQDKYGSRLTLIWGNFAHITTLLKKHGITKVDGILADFGTSQFQIHEKPGFSFAHDSYLDMRMSPGHYKTTAADIVNKASEAELADIIFKFGEEPRSRRIARAIVENRKEFGPIETTGQLAEIIEAVLPRYGKKIHPATKIFQALRIFVNDELNNINSLLTQSLSLLNPHGRLVCISFHSLEDRLVKQFLRSHCQTFDLLTKKIVIASSDELEINPSSRSAKLRAAEKKL